MKRTGSFVDLSVLSLVTSYVGLRDFCAVDFATPHSYLGTRGQIPVPMSLITVYTTKTGYDNSETATATLCWIDVEPKKEGITDGITNIPARAVMIQSNGGILTIQGAEDGTPVSVYGINGTQEGAATVSNGSATINTTLQPGSVAIVKIGQKSVKVTIK